MNVTSISAAISPGMKTVILVKMTADAAINKYIRDFATTLPPFTVQRHVQAWLQEDIPTFDYAGAVVGDVAENAIILCKTNGVLSGVCFVNAVFKELGCSVEWYFNEGQELSAPATVGMVTGSARNILMGERLALNILSRASGVASEARKAVRIAESAKWNGQIAGTRKTTPGFRIVEKYSLLVGGISQHRNDLSSMVMLKDNHIWSAGDITKAVAAARTGCGFSQKIEVECRTYKDACSAALAGAEVVMLDNFAPETAKKTAAELKKEFPHLLVEISGGITHDKLQSYFSEDIDVLSMSCLTQGYKCVDFSMKVKKQNRDPTNPTVHTTSYA